MLDARGALTLRWKCPNPPAQRGTIYQVWRRIGAEGAFTYLGELGKRKFVDATVPAGSPCVTYQIRGVRSTIAGPSGSSTSTSA